MGEETERPATTTASIGAPVVERPIVHRSPAMATAGSSRHAKTQARRPRYFVGKPESPEVLICIVHRSILRRRFSKSLEMRVSCFLSVAMLSILMASPASGQTMAALQGRVSDSSGAALPGASVTARDVATGLTSVARRQRRGTLSPPGHHGGYLPGHGRGPRVPFRANRIADVRGRPDAGP